MKSAENSPDHVFAGYLYFKRMRKCETLTLTEVSHKSRITVTMGLICSRRTETLAIF